MATRIALDAMGGDFAPAVPVEGAVEALRELPASCEVVLIGRAAEVDAALQATGAPRERLSIVDAPEVVTMADKPLAAVRSKPRSSIRVGLDLHKQGEVDAFISAGNTGAVMAASTLILRLHEGVTRPAIATVLPTAAEPVLLLDAGANVDCAPRELRGFAHLGSVYARDVMKRANPKVGLLNIGEEPEKGSEAVRETHRLLVDDRGIAFVGNVEGHDILQGSCDVVVCDGFVGNALLKFSESMVHLFRNLLEREIEPSLLAGDVMRRLFRVLDYAEYGGAPLLGVQGVSIICHGRSPALAIKNAIRVALEAVESQMNQHIGAEFAGGGAAA